MGGTDILVGAGTDRNVCSTHQINRDEALGGIAAAAHVERAENESRSFGMSGLRRRTKAILFPALTAVIWFVTVDTGYRLFRHITRQPSQKALYEPDPVLGRRKVKGASVLVSNWDKPQPNRVSINAFGFRGPNPRTVDKPPGMIRVIVQGGSTTEDYFVEDGRTWPEQLQDKLNARLKTDRIEVINMGTSGYTAENCVKDLKLNGLQLNPDVVIAYHGVNDFRKALKSLNELEPIESYVDYEGRESTWWSRLLCSSCIINAINEACYYKGGARTRAFALDYWNSPDKSELNLDGIEAPNIQALQELLELSKKHRFTLVIGRQATLMKPSLTDEEVMRMWRVFRWKTKGKCIKWESYLEARNRVVDAQARFAEVNGITYIDTESAVPKTTEYFVDDAHTLENGAERISDSFMEGLMSLGILDALLGHGMN
jgi:lysophospholipase L1-like esterase